MEAQPEEMTMSVRPRRGCATVTTRGKLEERGDSDAGDAAKSLGRATTRAPSHGYYYAILHQNTASPCLDASQ